jgi:hypothetical protein
VRTVTFQSVLEGVATAMGLTPSRDLTANRAAAYTEYINRRVQEGWRFEFWPEWTVTEDRQFRDTFNVGEFIQAGMERYYPASQNYYLALQDQVMGATQPPALLVNGTYTDNSPWWVLCNQSYQANDWAPNTVYAVKTQVRNPTDGKFYQCISAHTSSATFDATKFGLLVPFNKYIAWTQTGRTPIDSVKGIYRRNPEIYTNNPGSLVGFTTLGAGGLAGAGGAGYGALGFGKSDKGVQVDWRAPATVWVVFRTEPPIFTTTAWQAGKPYDLGDVVFYQGDCYRSLVGNNLSVGGPYSDWELMPMPRVLSSFVTRAAFSDALRDQKQTDRATDELAEAYNELADAQDRELAQQGQFDTASVVTYGR